MEKRIFYASGNRKDLLDIASLVQDNHDSLYFVLNDQEGLAFETNDEKEKFNGAKDFLWKRYSEQLKKADEISFQTFDEYLKNAADSPETDLKQTAEWYLYEASVVGLRYDTNLSNFLKKEAGKCNLDMLILLEDKRRLTGEVDIRSDPENLKKNVNYTVGEFIQFSSPKTLGLYGFKNLEALKNLGYESYDLLILGGNPPQNDEDFKEVLNVLRDRSKIVLEVGNSNQYNPPEKKIGQRTELRSGKFFIDDNVGKEEIEVVYSIETNGGSYLSPKMMVLSRTGIGRIDKIISIDDYEAGRRGNLLPEDTRRPETNIPSYMRLQPEEEPKEEQKTSVLYFPNPMMTKEQYTLWNKRLPVIPNSLKKRNVLKRMFNIA